MSIFIDATEGRNTSALPDIPGAKVSTTLEALTGADIMISPLTMPCTTPVLVTKHIKAGAILIQRKSAEDLVHSIGNRILSSLAKMRDTKACQWQCILLSTGFFVPNFSSGTIWVGRLLQDNPGQPGIIWHNVDWQYKALATELRRYAMRGGTYIPLTCDEEIPSWCRQAEEDLIKLKQDNVKELWPDAKDYPPDPPLQEDVLQELRPVTDGRTVLSQFAGIGPVIANTMWNTIREQNKTWRPGYDPEPTLAQAIFWLSAEDPTKHNLPHVAGYGKGKRAAVRKQLGLWDGQDFMAVQMDVPEVEEKAEDREGVLKEILHGDGKGEL